MAFSLGFGGPWSAGRLRQEEVAEGTSPGGRIASARGEQSAKLRRCFLDRRRRLDLRFFGLFSYSPSYRGSNDQISVAEPP